MISSKDNIRKVVHEALPKALQRCCCRPITSSDGGAITAVSGIMPGTKNNRWNSPDDYSNNNMTTTHTLSLASENNVSSPPSQLGLAESENMQTEWEQEDVYRNEDPKEQIYDAGSEDIEKPLVDDDNKRSSSHAGLDIMSITMTKDGVADACT